MKTIGMIGGMSWESTAVYYRLLNQITRERQGGLHSARLLLYSFDFQEIESYQMGQNWAAATERLVQAAHALERAGADCLIICTNTMHKVAPEVVQSVGVPLLHIADAAGEAIVAARLTAPLLLATRFTVEEDFYVGRLRDKYDIRCVIPDSRDREQVHNVIYQELCRGQVSEGSKTRFLEIIEASVAAGADSVIFGCTEIGLLLQPEEVSVPVIDTTAVHVAAALDFALGADAGSS
ncbi:MAG: aspartate/glutamate racemase family protein [Pseudomonadales bacterium]